MADRHMLILGCGSVGKRHARNLAALGGRISCFDPRADRRAELAAETPVVQAVGSLEKALAIPGLDGVVVASPTACHPEQAIRALKLGLPVLLEKPPARTLAEAEEMRGAEKEAGGPVLLGYTWRWWPPLSRVRELLHKARIGRMLHVQFRMSAHLADWHPWEPYRDFFMASAALGGGALLDESHWIDLMLWFFGRPRSLYGQVEQNSTLEIETDDNVDILVNYANGLRVAIHLDLYGRPHEKSIRFSGEEGTILWSAESNRVSIGTNMEQQWEHEEFHCERNDMFLGVAREFLAVLDGNPVRTCGLSDGVRVMEVVEAIRKSQAEKRLIRLD